MKYKKKYVEVDAIQWTGENLPEVVSFTNGNVTELQHNQLLVANSESDRVASIGEYIIKGTNDELHVSTPGAFLRAYEPLS